MQLQRVRSQIELKNSEQIRPGPVHYLEIVQMACGLWETSISRQWSAYRNVASLTITIVVLSILQHHSKHDRLLIEYRLMDSFYMPPSVLHIRCMKRHNQYFPEKYNLHYHEIS